MLNHAEIIESAIQHEEWQRDNADACDRHFWDGWDAATIRAGHLVVQVSSQSPALGERTRFVVHLVVKGTGEGNYASTPVEAHVETVSTRLAGRRDGLEGYAHRLAARLHGADIPVEYRRHV